MNPIYVSSLKRLPYSQNELLDLKFGCCWLLTNVNEIILKNDIPSCVNITFSLSDQQMTGIDFEKRLYKECTKKVKNTIIST